MPAAYSPLLAAARAAALAAFVLSTAAEDPSATTIDESRYVACIAAGDYPGAADAARAGLADRHDARSWAYVAAARALAGAHREAADAFMRAECAGGAGFFDKNMLYLRAQALARVKANARARAALAVLSDRYPFSRLAAKDEDLSLRIDQRLAAGVDATNLNWYRAEIAAARSEPGLAIEYGEEFLLLSARAGQTSTDNSVVRFGLATAYLQLGSGGRATTHLASIPDDYQDYRGVLLKGMARYAEGQIAEASEQVAIAAARTTDPYVRQRAERLLGAWRR
ncbi:MAG: hypothetical protein H0V44_14065 [Planctomycetes bacterium]|nr:hypothetical protein [Planctomycetota bacterium]